MPTLPTYNKCAELNCKNQRSKYNQFCNDHGGIDSYRVNDSDDRKQFNSMYQTKSWKVLRLTQLGKQPLCQSCLAIGIVKEAHHVDHLFPWAKIGRRAFHNNIFQSLCHECHTSKTALEQRGVIRHYDQVVTDYALNDYNSIVTQLEIDDTL